MENKILEPRYVNPTKPLRERNYFFVALIFIISFFGYSMWVLHQEAPTIPVVRKWHYSQQHYYSHSDSIYTYKTDTLIMPKSGNIAIGYKALHSTTGTLNVFIGVESGRRIDE